jgi:hypothetical protein
MFYIYACPARSSHIQQIYRNLLKKKEKKDYTTFTTTGRRTMARATTHTQGPKAFPGRGPVADADHPLGEAPASGTGSPESIVEALAESEEDYPPAREIIREMAMRR